MTSFNSQGRRIFYQVRISDAYMTGLYKNGCLLGFKTLNSRFVRLVVRTLLRSVKHWVSREAAKRQEATKVRNIKGYVGLISEYQVRKIVNFTVRKKRVFLLQWPGNMWKDRWLRSCFNWIVDSDSGTMLVCLLCRHPVGGRHTVFEMAYVCVQTFETGCAYVSFDP